MIKPGRATPTNKSFEKTYGRSPQGQIQQSISQEAKVKKMSEGFMESSNDNSEFPESQTTNELLGENQDDVAVAQDDRTVDELLQDIFNISPDEVPESSDDDDAARAAWLGEDNGLRDGHSKASDTTSNAPRSSTQDVQSQDPEEPSTEDLRKSIADRETDLRFLEDMQNIRHQSAMNTIGNIR